MGMKRAFDVVLALCGLAVLSPLLLLLVVMIPLASKGPVFYTARRVGRGGRLFKVYKFRSMVAHAAELGPGITGAGDPRVTGLGRLLRRTKLDEVPQLLNVVRGDMSLVGPRPEGPQYVELYTPEQRRVLNVRPGVTSPASVGHRSEDQLLCGSDCESTYVREVLPRKLEIELDYLARRTFWTDFAVIAKTLLALLR
jgi:lipopolysaccharide/colanic/teichoic acid biosynthesis glycosyltransferase